MRYNRKRIIQPKYNTLMGKGNVTIIQESNEQITTTIPRALAQAVGMTKGVKAEWQVAGKGQLLVKIA